jgi:hypothetical protein
MVMTVMMSCTLVLSHSCRGDAAGHFAAAGPGGLPGVQQEGGERFDLLSQGLHHVGNVVPTITLISSALAGKCLEESTPA